MNDSIAPVTFFVVERREYDNKWEWQLKTGRGLVISRSRPEGFIQKAKCVADISMAKEFFKSTTKVEVR